jgi:hypothetical protein
MIADDKVHKDCKGCRTYMFRLEANYNDLRCMDKHIKKCPCRKCIIKSMCKTECEEYLKVVARRFKL